MAKFLVKASYTAEGARGLIKEGGTGRRNAVQKLVEGLGGKVEAFYYAYGEDDVYVITDLPDSTAGVCADVGGERGGRCSPDDHPTHYGRRDRCSSEESCWLPRARCVRRGPINLA